MNILHLKYAVEVARAGSINKAAEILLVAQPNLSRSIKELEADLGITIFDRSAKGMCLTPDGEAFIGYAKKILHQITEVEDLYKAGKPAKQQFSISVPRASYIADAFAQFVAELSLDPAEIFYKETNSERAIENILHADYNLGSVRYAEKYERYYKELLEVKGLAHEVIAEFHYVLMMRADSPLNAKEEIRFEDLCPYIEIAHADPYVPTLPMAQVRKEELPDNIDRRVYVFERASQFELLSENRDAFMWVSPGTDKIMQRYGLVQRECADNKKVYRDVLICRKDYRPTELDERFIDQLARSCKKHLKQN